MAVLNYKAFNCMCAGVCGVLSMNDAPPFDGAPVKSTAKLSGCFRFVSCIDDLPEHLVRLRDGRLSAKR